MPPKLRFHVVATETVEGRTQVFGYLERSGGEQPTAQVRLPNDTLIYPRIQDIELSKRLAAHHHEDLFFTLMIRLNAATGAEVGTPTIVDFKPYHHVPFHDVVLGGGFDRVGAVHGSVDELLRERESLNRAR